MKHRKENIDPSKLMKIVEGFKKMGITEEHYPEYIEPYSFTQNFTECSALKSVPLITIGSTQAPGA